MSGFAFLGFISSLIDHVDRRSLHAHRYSQRGRVTFQSVSLPSGSSVTSLRAGMFVDMKHRRQKDEGESDESVWERNATRIPPTHKTQPAGHISAALTAATDCETCTLRGDETKMHGCKYACAHTNMRKYSTNTQSLVVRDRSTSPNLFFQLKLELKQINLILREIRAIKSRKTWLYFTDCFRNKTTSLHLMSTLSPLLATAEAVPC